MLAGAWVLVLLPLADVLQASGWDSVIPTWTPFDFRGTVRTLGDTLLFTASVYAPVLFCIGVVMLFSRERGRRAARLDWTRRWGVICSYVTFLLAAAPVLFISALVMVGIGALFLSMPFRYQPRLTKTVVDVSAAYLRYGPQPNNLAGLVQVAFSSVAVLLACVPLYDALRSSGPRRPAAALVGVLALFSLWQLAEIGGCLVGIPGPSQREVERYDIYFFPAGVRQGDRGAAGPWRNGVAFRRTPRGIGKVVGRPRDRALAERRNGDRVASAASGPLSRYAGRGLG